MAVNPTAKFCRRLFQDSAPRIVATRTLEHILQAEEERFCQLWKFDVSGGSSNNWQLIRDPVPEFYTRAPRHLKARRRLNDHSVLDRIRSQMKSPEKRISSDSALVSHIVFDFSSPRVENPQPDQSSSCNLSPSTTALTELPVVSAPASTSVQIQSDGVFKVPPPVSRILKRKIKPRLTDYFLVKKRTTETKK